jgi:hypothetical protein
MNIKLPRADRRVFSALALASLSLALVACQAAPPASGTFTSLLLGRVDAPAGAKAIVVAKDDSGHVVHRAYLEQSRRYAITVPAGRVSVYAFVDENQDGWLGATEPASARLVLAAPVKPLDRIELPRLHIRTDRLTLAAK